MRGPPKMIIRARWVVTMDGPPIENGAVAVNGATIAAVGRWDDVRAATSGDLVDLGESALLPGLINAHCHLDYTNLRGAIPRQSCFTDWIRAINAAKTTLTPNDYLQSIAAGLAEAAGFGTTTIANLEAFPELLEQMPAPPMRVWWFAEMIDVRTPVPASEIYSKMRRAFDRDSRWLGDVGLAPHAPFTASVKLYAEASELAIRHGLTLTTHLAESRDEMEMFRDGRGELFNFMRNIGRPAEDCGGITPLALLLSHGILNERWIIAHLNELSDGDFELLAGAPKFSIVHCPRSHARFGHSRFRLNEIRALGFNVCLGTDSLASNDDLSLFAEMRELSRVESGLAPMELLKMVTVNAAAALRQSDSLGRIRAGSAADLICIPCGADGPETLARLVHFDGQIPWRMLGGRQMSRNPV